MLRGGSVQTRYSSASSVKLVSRLIDSMNLYFAVSRLFCLFFFKFSLAIENKLKKKGEVNWPNLFTWKLVVRMQMVMLLAAMMCRQ